MDTRDLIIGWCIFGLMALILVAGCFGIYRLGRLKERKVMFPIIKQEMGAACDDCYMEGGKAGYKQGYEKGFKTCLEEADEDGGRY